MNRRTFLERITLGATAIVGAIVSLPIIGYLFAPLFSPDPAEFVEVGQLADFTVGETKEVRFRDPSPLPWAGQTADTALWVRRRGLVEFQVFNVNCTHLGCPVNWRQKAQLFLCPCHGGVFNEDGTVAGGPPPRPLYERDWKVEGSRLLVRGQRLQTPASGGA